ncbi:MAG: AAA family ATPase [Acidobacteriaceae bacterium]|nr:AAA family ATPase [Acidobacteriaceae bacterium]
MYHSHFGLKRTPFSTAADPSLLLMDDMHRDALAGLWYAIVARKGFVTLIGEAGTGKTTLIRKALDVLSKEKHRASVIFNPTLTPAEFLEAVLTNFGVADIPESKVQRLRLLEDLLAGVHKQENAAVLIVDEAHKLSPELLEEIRLLTNFELGDQKLLQIVLAGQTELGDVLNRTDLWQLKQRITVRLQIGRLPASEVQRYITYRWNKASESTSKPPFTAAAVVLIERSSLGIPRLINVICDNALTLAFGAGLQVVDAAQVADAVRDLDLNTAEAQPRRPAPAPASPEPLALVRRARANNLSIRPELVGLPTLTRYTEQKKGFFNFARRFRAQRVVTIE